MRLRLRFISELDAIANLPGAEHASVPVPLSCVILDLEIAILKNLNCIQGEINGKETD